MFTNPFSPIFGGKPDVFFGRENILKLFEHAMLDPGSDDRAIFITGTRGCGKTSLLEQLSIRAKSRKRKVIDLGPEGGNRGGTIVATGTPEEIAECSESYTGHFLKKLLK